MFVWFFLWNRRLTTDYLILARAKARRSVFWNKARTRLFISGPENSMARGPFPSAHLQRDMEQ